MPTYEYYCEKCKQNEDILKPFSQAEDLELCKTCDIAMKKQYGTFGINLKGPGFYSTDNRK